MTKLFRTEPKALLRKSFFMNAQQLGLDATEKTGDRKEKYASSNFFSTKMVESFRVIRGEEVAELVNKLREVSSSDARYVNISEYSGHNYSKVKESVGKIMVHLAAFTGRDYLPLMGWVDVLTGKIREYKATFEALDAVFEQVIAEHLTAKTHSKRKDSSESALPNIIILKRIGVSS
ncbi:Cytochrome P450 [Spatholobus suberectus]|nr:Cytochrome P450 [Spatholobus suberectus]